MQQRDSASLDPTSNKQACVFCQHSEISDILKETEHFLLIADYAPLVEGHLLIIPKNHFACYGDVPATLDEELFALKDELREFYNRYYAPVVFWEHGVFRQTVFHAHLHCFPWGNLAYDIDSQIHTMVITAQEDIRGWFHAQGHYFYLEDSQVALLFAPEMERYMHIVQRVFQRGLASQGAPRQMRTSQQRYAEGRPLIEAVSTHWRAFQQQTISTKPAF